MKAKYYMGAEALTSEHLSHSLTTFDTLEEAIAAGSQTVARGGKPRYIVKTVALVEPAPPPVKVTIVDEAAEWRR